MHFRLFDRPLIIDDPLSVMYIDGQYEDYDPGSAYEGRVQIHRSVGFCKVEVLDSNLPPGAYTYVDNVSKEVVVKWPKYTPPVEQVTLLENGDFSEGDTGSWTNTGEGNPFVIEPDSSGNMSMKFKSGFSGGHFSRSPLAPVENINRQITLTGDIAQGKSSKRKLWGGLLLAWFDKDGNILSWNESNWINSGGDYKQAKVIAAPTNPLTKFVAAQIHFDRRGQNHPGWADNIKWDHVWTKGYDSDEQLFVEVLVTDSLNNTARHRGVIDEVSLWMTSGMAPIYYAEGLRSQASFGRAVGWSIEDDYIQSSASFVSAATDEVVKYTTYTMPPQDYFRSGAAFLSAQTEALVKYTTYTVPAESFRPGAGFLSGSTLVQNYIRNTPPESIRSAAQFVSGGTS